ncbi:MAG: D-aminoacyl-tRNA deacylase [archaeon]
MHSKYLIIASKKDPAGIGITTALSQFRKTPVLSVMEKDSIGFDFYLVDEEIIYTENLNLEKINKYDFVVFASKHKSEKKEKTLSVHAPGNWRLAEFGGQPQRICPSSGLFQKALFESLQENAKKFKVEDYAVTLECTHHGPLIERPCIFIEIGSTEKEWADRKAAFVISKAIAETIENFKENPYREVAVGIGGPHYCPSFNKIQLRSNVALSHVIPQYSLPLSEEMVREAIMKTHEEIDFFLLDWKGLGNSEQRQQVTNLLDKLGATYKRTSDISK